VGPVIAIRFTALLLAACGTCAWAQHAERNVQRGGTFIEPPAQVDPLYLPVGPDQPAGSQEPTVQLRLGADLPLSRGVPVGSGAQGAPSGSPTAQAFVRWRPVRTDHWYVHATFFHYVDPARQRPWNPDFTYGFGWDTGKPGSWSFGYANYTGTRLGSQASERRFNFPQGQWSASYRFELPDTLQRVFLAGDGDSAMCNTGANLVPRYTRRTGGSLASNKVSLALGCRYQRPDGFFAHATLLAWPRAGTQQPWDPDYVYGFGWTGPGGLTIQYANYSGNRLFGRERAPGQGRLENGSVSIGWATAW
jgi:hypothetical protein